MVDERRIGKHSLTLDQRENLSVTGVIDVISFDEETIIAETEKGVIIVKGVNFHVNKLNLDNGELAVSGEVAGITYEDDASAKGKSSFFGKLFR